MNRGGARTRMLYDISYSHGKRVASCPVCQCSHDYVVFLGSCEFFRPRVAHLNLTPACVKLQHTYPQLGNPGKILLNVLCIMVARMCRMLTALDDDLDEATERMNFVMGRLGKLLKTKSEYDRSTTPAHSAHCNYN